MSVSACSIFWYFLLQCRCWSDTHSCDTIIQFNLSFAKFWWKLVSDCVWQMIWVHLIDDSFVVMIFRATDFRHNFRLERELLGHAGCGGYSRRLFNWLPVAACILLLVTLQCCSPHPTSAIRTHQHLTIVRASTLCRWFSLIWAYNVVRVVGQCFRCLGVSSVGRRRLITSRWCSLATF